ncbi:MAG: hypothetical protein BMS9Abin39_0942 [Ignavibacteria bacterium]|nr:MAG: hypothetical protein BMS9Abin39_0942 [Ignavibacteria bacterium]
MIKLKSVKFWIIFGMLAFATVSILLIFKIYNLTLQEAKTSHQQQQMQMAKTAVQGISYYLDHLVGDMNLLNDLFIKHKYNSSEVQSHLNYFHQHYDNNIVRSIFLTDTNANIYYTTVDSIPEWLTNEIQLMYSKNNKAWYSMVQPFDEVLEDRTLFFLILLKSGQNYSFSKSFKNSSGAGIIGYLIKFDDLMERFIVPLKLGKSDFAWVLDKKGRLIFHPKHTKMLLNSVIESPPECIQCHSSFEMQKSMLDDQKSVAEYTIGDEPTKIMAYVPLILNNETWILAISTYLPEVTANLRENFRLFFILGFIIFGGIIFFGSLLYFINLKRIRAEEGKRNLEKIQDYQAQLNQASKLASIGELVDTVTHEINTPIGIISAHADALLLKKTYSDDIGDALKIIKKQTRRISEYTRSILSYSQSIPFYPELINIEELINECTFLLDHRFRANNITVRKIVDSNLEKVYADKRQMEQVFINLLNNAVDAIKDKGEIKISLKRKIVKSDSGDETKEGIIISIEDNGMGIQDDYIDKIFNPFFSTKSKTQGTGLGLAITKAIIVRHKGRIEVTSKNRQGTLFTIFLPKNIN